MDDATLLKRFKAKREEAAFRLLVERHGPLVLGVCRRNTYCHEDAEDAFQATFLVLAQSAQAVRRGASLSAWLYGVALRLSARVRRSRPCEARRDLEDEVVQDSDPLDELLARHDGMIADEELSALPDKLRLPLVLRYLAGKNNQETAAELKISVATLEGRLKRGKSRLRARLLRRGVTLTAVVALLKATRVDAAQLPQELITTTTTLGCTTQLSDSLPLATQDPTVTHIALQELRTMNLLSLPKLIVPFGVAGVVVMALGAHLAHSQGATDREAALSLQSQVEAAAADAGDLTVATLSQPPANGDFEREDIDLVTPAVVGDWTLATSIDTKPRTGLERAIEIGLAKPLAAVVDFQEAPLEEVIEYLGSETELPIVFDEVALDSFAISPDEPVTVKLPRGLKLESVLRHILGKLELEAIVADEVLLITNDEGAERRSDARVYRTSAAGLPSSALRKLLLSSVRPDSWAEQGGTAEVEALPSGDLLVRQSYNAHQEVAEVLRQVLHSSVSPTEASAAPSLAQPEPEVAASDQAPRQNVDRLRALKDRLRHLTEEVRRKQEAYNALSQDLDSTLSPTGALKNELDIKLLTQLNAELLEMRRKDATTNHQAPVADYIEELRGQIAELTRSVTSRAKPNPDLMNRGNEIERLQQIANDLIRQIEDLQTELAVGSQG